MLEIHLYAIERMRRDHTHLMQLIDRILAECGERGQVADCNGCAPGRRGVCHGNIEQTIRAFVEATLKHNLMESALMDSTVPETHRIRHNQAHMDLAVQLRDIRVVFAKDGNGVVAIEGIDRVHATLLEHFREYDAQLERYLAESAEEA